ncbi:MAG: hypothetical protein FWF83_02795 [Clostridiales bacterium]|nr:hypothetical protein [Clostridiales bacterium]
MEILGAEGKKCQRCWNYHTEVNEEGLCPRCARVLERMKNS